MLSAKEAQALVTSKIAQAQAHPGKLARVRAGYYFLCSTSGTLVEIEQLDEGSCAGMWLVRDAKGRFYNDPVWTLSQALEQSLSL